MDTLPEAVESSDASAGEPNGRLERCGQITILALLAGVFLTTPMTEGVQTKHITLVMGAALVLGLGVFSASRATRGSIPTTPATLGLILLAAAVLLGIPGARSPDMALFVGILPLSLLILHCGTLFLIRDTGTLRLAVPLLLLMGAIVSMFGLQAFLEFRADLASGSTSESLRSMRLSTPFFQHSYLAALPMAPLIPLGLGAILSRGSRWYRLLCVLLLAPVLTYLLIILSRATILAVGSGLLVVLIGAMLYRPGHRRLVPRAPIIVTLIAVVGLIAAVRFELLGSLSEDLSSRFSDLLDPKQRGFQLSRLQVWEDSARMIADSGPFGVGSGQFRFEFVPYYEGQGYISHAHNQYLHTLAENGPLGLLGLSLALLHPLVLGFRALTRVGNRTGLAGALLGAVGALVTMAVHFCAETPLTVPASIALFAILTAVVISLARMVDPGLVAVTQWDSVQPRRTVRIAAMLAVCFAALGAFVMVRDSVAGNLAIRGLDALQAGKPAEAVDLCAQASRVAPYQTWPRKIEVGALMAVGDLETAREVCRKALALAPGVPEMLYEQGHVCVLLRDYEGAIGALKQMRKAKREKLLEIEYQLATCLFESGRLEEARILYQNLIARRYQGELKELYLQFARTLRELGRSRELSDQLLRMYLTVAPEDQVEEVRELLEEE